MNKSILKTMYIYIICILYAILLVNCNSLSASTSNFSETYLLQNMAPFSMDNPLPNNQARQWYFAPYTSVIPNLQIHSGTYLSEGEILAAHLLWGDKHEKGTAILIHGYDGSVLNTHFQYFAQQYIKQGYKVVLLNIPGHGFSGGKRGDVKDFANYGSMLFDFLELTEGQLGENLVLMGHSVGAIAIYDAFITFPDMMEQVDASVLITPFKDLKFSGLYQAGSFIIAGVHIEQTKLLRLDTLSMKWVKKERQWSKKIEGYPQLSGKEILLVFAEDDEVIKNEKSQEFFREKIRDKEIRVYTGQGHTLVRNGYKQFREETLDWVFSKLPQGSDE